MADELLTGDKEIAAAFDMSPESVRREIETYPDPLPARNFRGRRVWARRSRVALWRQRHPEDKASHPVAGLDVARGMFAIGKVVRLSAKRCYELVSWASEPPADPLPVWRGVDGAPCAYRDALIDWLDRQSGPAASPRRRRKLGPGVGQGRRQPETAGTRETQKARVQSVREVVIDGPPQGKCDKVGKAA